MRVKLAAFWQGLQSSYWFVPAVMSLGATALFATVLFLDVAFQIRWLDRTWLLSGRPEGTRDLLATVAASLITVGGVAFSVTIGAVAYSATQYGPRLLSNFMHDRGNQLALGTFISTFLFSLLVLLSIREAGENGEAAFVPQLALACELVLIVFSLAVLIYFFHHVPESIQAFNVLAQIGEQFNSMVGDLFPEQIGEGGCPEIEHVDKVEFPDGFAEQSRLVRAEASGYVQAVDDQGLFDVACKHDLILRLLHRPGDFVNCGRAVLLAWPAGRVSDDLADTLAESYVVGNQRTPYQDALFMVKELIEIAARALSTGQNDPYTAINCLNWLGSNLVTMASRAPPDPRRFDANGKLRIVAESLTFDQLADTIFDHLRPYVKNDANVAVHTMDMIRWVAPQLRSARQRETLLGHAKALKASCEGSLGSDRNLAIVLDLYRNAVKSLTTAEEAVSEADPGSISRAARQQG